MKLNFNTDFIWIFKTPVKDWFSYFKNRFASSRYVVKGKCKQCGMCCENILFSDEKGYIKTFEQFENLKKRNLRYHHFFIHGKMDNSPGNGDGCFKQEDFENPTNQAGALLFKCKSLNEHRKCKHYFLRSICCRDYPAIDKTFISHGGQTLDGCGFYFDIDKKFSEYLKV